MKESFPAENKEGASYENFKGLWSENFDAPRRIKARSGVLSLATSIGGRSGENEDAILLDTEHDIFAAIDGMGGYEKGAIAAQIVGEEMLKVIESGGSIESDLHKNAWIRMREAGLRRGGAVYAAAKITGKELRIWHAGDARVILVDPKGLIKFMTEDSQLSFAPRGEAPGHAEVDRTEIKNYDRIIATSDGLLQNIDLEKALISVKDLPVEQAIKELSAMAMQGMVHGVEGDPYAGNKDNLAIVIYEILPVPLRG